MGKAVNDFAIQGISFPLDRSAAKDSAGVSDVANVQEGEGVGSKGPIEGIFSDLGEDDSLVGEDEVVDGASEEENAVETESTSIGGESKLEQDRGLESISEQGSAVVLNPTQGRRGGSVCSKENAGIVDSLKEPGSKSKEAHQVFDVGFARQVLGIFDTKPAACDEVISGVAL
ncbi:hypothetical protein U1Q18_032809, partial [Sarracenia purpurea var. burkii]